MIRSPGSPEDWRRIRQICCETAQARTPIESSRWPFFGDYWIEPYQRLCASWSYIGLLSGQIEGYLTGCLDTVSFSRSCFIQVRISQMLKVSAGFYPKNQDTRKFLRRFFRAEKSPEKQFSRTVRAKIASEFPSHLHVNVRPCAQRTGLGRQLVTHYLEELRKQYSPGVHLHCGGGPVGFYQKLGFQELGRIEVTPGVWIYALGLRLSH